MILGVILGSPWGLAYPQKQSLGPNSTLIKTLTSFLQMKIALKYLSQKNVASFHCLGKMQNTLIIKTNNKKFSENFGDVNTSSRCPIYQNLYYYLTTLDRVGRLRFEKMLKSERHAVWIFYVVNICKNTIFLLSQYYSKTDTKNLTFFF